MRFLTNEIRFPNPRYAAENGLLAIGGDLSPERLLVAYRQGIFPWYDASQPILWWSPDPRMVLFPERLKISKSMRRLMKKPVFRATFNQNFEKVVAECARVARKGQSGTWITSEMQQAYCQLHKMNLAHSVEVWQDNELVGGLYGVYLKDRKVFCGESMFSKVSNASKLGFITWVQELQKKAVKLIDCQVYSRHMESLGAEEIPRERFLRFLE